MYIEDNKLNQYPGIGYFSMMVLKFLKKYLTVVIFLRKHFTEIV